MRTAAHHVRTHLEIAAATVAAARPGGAEWLAEFNGALTSCDERSHVWPRVAIRILSASRIGVLRGIPDDVPVVKACGDCLALFAHWIASDQLPSRESIETVQTVVRRLKFRYSLDGAATMSLWHAVHAFLEPDRTADFLRAAANVRAIAAHVDKHIRFPLTATPGPAVEKAQTSFWIQCGEEMIRQAKSQLKKSAAPNVA